MIICNLSSVLEGREGSGPAITHFQNDGTQNLDLLIDFIPTIIAGLPARPVFWTLTPDWPERVLASAQYETIFTFPGSTVLGASIFQSITIMGDGFPFLDRRKAMSLIEEIKEALSMEIRSNSQGLEYLEAVLHRKDLELLNSLLEKHIGLAAKESRKEANLPKEIEELVDSLGGLRNGQSFFYRQDGNQVIYAAIWPWESDPNKITLKSGVSEIGQG